MNPGSLITKEEFSNNLRRRNIDNEFNDEDQRLFFEKFDPHGNNKIQVDDIYEYINIQDIQIGNIVFIN